MSAVPQSPASGIDLDSQETREWMDALSAVIEKEGPERAHFLLEQLLSHARQNSMDITKLTRKIRIEMPRQNAEIETQSLSVSRLRAYSNTRRGMPIRPRKCWTKKARLKPANVSQNWIRPQRSESIRPDIFGNQ